MTNVYFVILFQGAGRVDQAEPPIAKAPVEVLHEILKFIDDRRSLKCAMLSHRLFNDAFHISPVAIVWSTILREISPDVLPLAMRMRRIKLLPREMPVYALPRGKSMHPTISNPPKTTADDFYNAATFTFDKIESIRTYKLEKLNDAIAILKFHSVVEAVAEIFSPEFLMTLKKEEGEIEENEASFREQKLNRVKGMIYKYEIISWLYTDPGARNKPAAKARERFKKSECQYDGGGSSSQGASDDSKCHRELERQIKAACRDFGFVCSWTTNLDNPYEDEVDMLRARGLESTWKFMNAKKRTEWLDVLGHYAHGSCHKDCGCSWMCMINAAGG
ncbi:hypothetical protein GGR57DRAFT_504757 [Xylariaceae sp. FL1272]|nr:hypothetical protein GGR57DRAFT_504757 [Xylariaceae sp. FL1272]